MKMPRLQTKLDVAIWKVPVAPVSTVALYLTALSHYPSTILFLRNSLRNNSIARVMFGNRTLFGLLAASLSFLAGIRAESDVLDLTAADFDATIKENPLVLAEFFAPWVDYRKRAIADVYVVRTL